MTKYIEVNEYNTQSVLPQKYRQLYEKEGWSAVTKYYRQIHTVKVILNLDAIKCICPVKFSCKDDNDDIIIERYNVYYGKDETIQIDVNDYRRIKEALFTEKQINTL